MPAPRHRPHPRTRRVRALMATLACVVVLCALPVRAAEVSFFTAAPPAPGEESRLRAAARHDDSEAQFLLGFLLAGRAEREMREGWHGKGRILFKEAATWLRRAARQDHPRAQFALGYLHLRGLGVPRDAALARKWLTTAARKDIPDAMLLLGTMDMQGEGARQNVQRGTGLLASAGMAFARERRFDLALESARRLSAFRPGHPAVKVIVQEVEQHGTQPESPDTLSTGTGWPVAEGYVVTNLHVVRGRPRIDLLLEDGTRLTAYVAEADMQSDLVLLGVEDPCTLPPALPLAAQPPGLGASVFTIGFPQVAIFGASPKLSTGRISGLKGIQDDPRTFTISVPLSSGNSGGPLVNDRGEVVGVVQAVIDAQHVFHTTGELPGEMNYALRAELVRSLIARAPRHTAGLGGRIKSIFGMGCPGTLSTGERSLETLASAIQHSVLLVVAR
ncbi:tetratricopeptide repeat-containing serine protease family protein [Desulfobaculum senezii]